MSKLMYVNKTQFAQLQGVLTEIFKKEFSECSAEDQKKILRAVNAKSIKDLLPKQPRVFTGDLVRRKGRHSVPQNGHSSGSLRRMVVL